MNSILYVGMDVHTTNFTLATFSIGDEKAKFVHTVAPDYKQILLYLEMVRTKVAGLNGKVDFVCGYEAGCLGYTLYQQLTEHHVKCVILAPTTLLLPAGKRVKTDKKDAELIARSLAYQTYSEVYVPTEQDNSVKEFIRMREDHRAALTKVKQQILAFCLRNGHHYTEGGNWTGKHLTWLRRLQLNSLLKETLNEYLLTYDFLSEKISCLDQRIEELAQLEQYAEKVRKLRCFLGVETKTALGTLVEISDFHRFPSATKFASYLGLVPGESSSGDRQQRCGITKAGNTHVRRMIVEAAQAYTRGEIGYRSRKLIARQKGNDSATIAYANKANERLRRKFYKMVFRGVKRNVAATAVARELACFMWGMMTDHMEPRPE